MEFLKKYWWAILLVVILGIVIYMMYAKKDTDSTKTKTGCNNTNAQWDAKLATQMQEIRDSPEWLKIAQDGAVANNMTLDEAIKSNADYHLRVGKKECNPYQYWHAQNTAV